MHKASKKNINRQLLKWSLVCLVLAPTIFLWLVAGSSLFGYRLVSITGTSMEPALYHGDTLWTKRLDPAEVKVGDIVILQHPALGQISHRVTKVQPLSQEGYLLETKGDANFCVERYETSADEKVRVSLAHVRYAGYALEFLGSVFGRALLIGVAAATLTAIWVRRLRMARGGG